MTQPQSIRPRSVLELTSLPTDNTHTSQHSRMIKWPSHAEDTHHLDLGGPLPKLGFNFRRAFDCWGTTEGTESPINSYSSLEIPCGLLLVVVVFF